MPADLPEGSQYTFAADLSLDEIGPTGRVFFDRTTYFYVDNFLGVPVGTIIPNGYYSYEHATWLPEANGLNIKIVGVTNGLADIEATVEDGIPETTQAYAMLGMTDEERQILAENFPVGSEVWRMPIEHLSPYDWNYAGIVATAPNPEPVAQDDTSEPEEPDCAPGSIIHCQSRELEERIRLVGTDNDLVYQSARSDANLTAERNFDLQLLGPGAPQNAAAVHVYAEVLGRVLIDQELPPTTANVAIIWDGFDAYGREVLEPAKLRYAVRYIATPQYSLAIQAQVSIAEASSFGYELCAPSNPCCYRNTATQADPQNLVIPARLSTTAVDSMALQQALRTTMLSAYSGRVFSMGGWSLQHYHRYFLESQTLAMGNGRTVRRRAVASHASVVVGRLSDGDRNNDPLTQGIAQHASEADISAPKNLKFGPDGSLYFVRGQGHFNSWDENDLYRMLPSGIIELVYNDTVSNSTFHDYAVTDDGTIYITKYLGLIKVKRNPVTGNYIPTTIVNSNGGPAWTDGLPLAGHRLSPQRIVVRDDGRVFMNVHQRDNGGSYAYDYGATDFQYDLVEILPDGRGRVTGHEMGEFIVNGPNNSILTYTIRSSPGEYLFGGRFSKSALYQLMADGRRIDIIGDRPYGDGTTSASTTPKPRSNVRFVNNKDINEVTSSRAGDIYVSSGHRILHFDTAGFVRIIGYGNLPTDFHFTTNPGSYRPDLNPLGHPYGVAVSPDNQLFVSELILNRIVKIGVQERETDDPATAEPSFSIPSKDGLEVYVFDLSGRHIRTTDTDTGHTLRSYTHNDDGELIAFADESGATTRVERGPGDEIRFVAPAGPNAPSGTDGPTTMLTLNNEGWVDEVRDPRGATWTFDYTNGLLNKMWGPRQNEGGLRSGTATEFEFEQTQRGRDRRFKLSLDKNALGDAQTLSTAHTRTVIPSFDTWCDGSTYQVGSRVTQTTSTVTKQSPLGRTTSFETTQPGPSRRVSEWLQTRPDPVTTTVTGPNGAWRQRTEPDRSSVLSASWPEGSSSTQLQSHPRLGTSAQFPSESTTTLAATSSGSSSRPTLVRSATTTIDSAYATSTVGVAGVPIADTETTTTTINEDRTSVTTYTAATRTFSNTTPEGRIFSWTLDDKSRLQSLTPPGEVPTVYHYDAQGNLASVSRTNGASVRSTTYQYDGNRFVSNVDQRTSATASLITQYSNDPGGLPQSITVPGIGSTALNQDSAGDLSAAHATKPTKPRFCL